MPRWSTARTPSSIAERIASVRPRSRAISASRPCSSSADWLMIRASSPSSSSRPHADAGGQVALRDWRAVSMISSSERPERGREQRATASPVASERQQARASAAARHSSRPAPRSRSMPRLEARDARPPCPSRGPAPPRRAASRPRSRCGARRARAWPASAPCTSGRSRVVLDRARARRRRPRSRRAPARPERSIVTRASTSRAAASTTGSSCVRAVPRRELLLDDAGHQPGLGGERSRRPRRGPAGRASGPASSSSTARATPAATTAVTTMRPRSDSLRFIRRPPGPYGTRAI